MREIYEKSIKNAILALSSAIEKKKKEISEDYKQESRIKR
jgi:hypothetical protein